MNMKKFLALAMTFAVLSAGAANAETKIRLTVNGQALNAVLNDTRTSRELAEKLPYTVRLNRGEVDYCGGRLGLNYDESDVQDGWKNCDLSYWTPGENFVIFFDGEELDRTGSHDQVIIGRVNEDVNVIRALPRGSVEVLIEKAE